MKLLKFYATWCGPCKVLEKKLEGFDLCPLKSIDIEENEAMVEKYGIKNVPTLILVDDAGNQVKRWTGLVDVNKLKNEISEVM